MADTLEMTAEEQRLLDQMRADDAQQPQEPEPAPPQPAPQPAPGDEPAEPPPPVPGQPAQQQQRDDRVPFAALSDERQRRQRVEGERDALQQQIRTLEERTNLLLQRFSQPAPVSQPAQEAQPQPPPLPELSQDPVGHIIGRQVEFDRRLQEYNQAQQQQQAAYQQQMQAQQVLNALVQHSQAMESQFTVDHPDYPAAVTHLKRTRHQELELAGFRNPVERENIITQEGLGVAARMVQAGGNPAQQIYELAKLRGYQPPSNGADNVSRETTYMSDAHGTVAINNGGPTPQQRLTTLQQGQAQARSSLGGVRGSAPPALTAQRLLELSDAEFDKMMQTPEGLALLGQGG